MGRQRTCRPTGSQLLFSVDSRGDIGKNQGEELTNLGPKHTHPHRYPFLVSSSQGQPSSSPGGWGHQPDIRLDGDGVASAAVCHSAAARDPLLASCSDCRGSRNGKSRWNSGVSDANKATCHFQQVTDLLWTCFLTRRERHITSTLL